MKPSTRTLNLALIRAAKAAIAAWEAWLNATDYTPGLPPVTGGPTPVNPPHTKETR